MSRERISQGRALLSGAAIFLYFVVTTAWFPSYLIRSPLLASAPKNVADGVIVVVWGGFLVLGVGFLRWAQDRELI